MKPSTTSSVPVDTAVILAAGRGSRMGRPSGSPPKALLSIGGQSLIEHQLQFLRSQGFRRCLIVRSPHSHGFETLQTYGLDVGWVDQQKPTGIVAALIQTQATISSSFFLLLGDIFFTPFDLWESARSQLATEWDSILLSRLNCSAGEVKRNFSIESDRSGRVIRVREKPFSVSSFEKGIGMYFLKPSIFKHLLAARLAGQGHCLTDCFQRMIDAGERILNCPVETEDVNVTTPSDLFKSRCLSLA